MRGGTSLLAPETRRVARTMLAVAVVSLLPRAMQLLFNLVLAAHFGTADEVDAYLAALLLPQSLVAIGAQTFAVALVPAYLARREADGAEAASVLAERALGFGIATM